MPGVVTRTPRSSHAACSGSVHVRVVYIRVALPGGSNRCSAMAQRSVLGYCRSCVSMRGPCDRRRRPRRRRQIGRQGDAQDAFSAGSGPAFSEHFRAARALLICDRRANLNQPQAAPTRSALPVRWRPIVPLRRRGGRGSLRLRRHVRCGSRSAPQRFGGRGGGQAAPAEPAVVPLVPATRNEADTASAARRRLSAGRRRRGQWAWAVAAGRAAAAACTSRCTQAVVAPAALARAWPHPPRVLGAAVDARRGCGPRARSNTARLPGWSTRIRLSTSCECSNRSSGLTHLGLSEKASPAPVRGRYVRERRQANQAMDRHPDN